MKKLFAPSTRRYAKMTCETCHGKKAADNKFKMPSAELPKLPQPTDRAGFMALQQKKPEVVKFMGTQVKPTMAALIGKAEWTAKNAGRVRLLRLPHQGRRRRCGSAARRGTADSARDKPAAGAPAAPAKGSW